MRIADYPNPDMAIEVDISPPQVGREDIYRQLKVEKTWYLDGREVTIKRLGEDGNDTVAERSQFLPIIAVETRR
jgi:hypothetical protein